MKLKLHKKLFVKHVLQELNIKYQDRGNELLARCVSGRHIDKNPSWFIHNELGSMKNGVFNCFSCGWYGTIYSLVQKVKGCDFLEAYKFLLNFQKKRGIDKSESVLYFDIFDDVESMHIPGGVVKIEEGSQCKKYLRSRGIDSGDIDKYCLQDWVVYKRVFVPLYRYRKIISWLSRTYIDAKPKIKNPGGTSLLGKRCFFGFDFLNFENKQIHLTEGWLSCIKLMNAGFKNVLATGGANITEGQVEDVSWCDEIVVWKEGDVGGKYFTQSIQEWFGGEQKLKIIELEKDKDPDNYSIGQLIKIYQGRY